jgi:inorganic pyrophosphatase
MIDRRDLINLPAFAGKSDEVNAIVDTPQGSQNKFKYDPESGLFKLGSAMPAGVVFPFEFGFIPSTEGGDGDPLDLLILMDASTFVGCLVRARLIGVIEAKQIEKRHAERNDRLIAVAVESRRHEHVRELRDLPKQLLAEVEHFFISYNAIKGKEFKPLGRYGSARALALVRKSMKDVGSKPR